MAERARYGRSVSGMCAALAFIGCVPLANYMVGHVGTECIPGGPCVVPVFPGTMAPSGVLIIGVAFVLRDVVQEALGAKWTLALIAMGAALSAWVAVPPIALASAVAFGVSELVDWTVYQPLRRRGLMIAVAGSGVVGLLVDSAVFLQLAFGGLELFWGQVFGKAMALGVAVAAMSLFRRRNATSSVARG